VVVRVLSAAMVVLVIILPVTAQQMQAVRLALLLVPRAWVAGLDYPEMLVIMAAVLPVLVVRRVTRLTALVM
jgi:hypothetical protein